MPSRRRRQTPARPRGPVARHIERQPVPFPGVATRELARRNRAWFQYMGPKARGLWLARGIAARYGEEI